jgi:SAM-dependent methyltransferase
MSVPTSYFDQMYAENADPWSLADRWYEQRKYALTLASLPQQRFRRAFEPGCSVGVLTAGLADRCDRLLAVDLVGPVADATADRLRGRPNVEIAQMAVPEEWPTGSFDLIVLSEIGYYFDPPRLATLVSRAADSLEPGGTLVAVHWRHPVASYSGTGDEVHRAIRRDLRLSPLVQHEEADFLLDVLATAPASSVAAAEGLV